MSEPSLPELEAERDLLYARLAATGDFVSRHSARSKLHLTSSAVITRPL